MPETLNPFRREQPNLDPNQARFLGEFSKASKEELEAAGVKNLDETPNELNTEDQFSFDQVASQAEKEEFENEEVEYAGKRVTRKEKAAVENVVDLINRKLIEENKEPISFENELKLYKIAIGNTSGSNLLDALNHTNNNRVSDSAKRMLHSNSFSSSPESKTIILLQIPKASIGMPDLVFSTKDLHDKAKEFQLGICPPEVGPQLRFCYQDQPEREVVLIAMKEINSSIFELRHDPGSLLTLLARDVSPSGVYESHVKFVFCVPVE